MNFGVDDARNLLTISKKNRSGQEQSKISESILYCHLHKIVEMNPHDREIVGSVTQLLRIADNNNCEEILERPISKLVLILEASYTDSLFGNSLFETQLMKLLNDYKIVAIC